MAGRVLRGVFKVVVTLVLLLFLFLFVVAGTGRGGIEFVIVLLFGWIGFLQRTFPQISWNWDLVLMALFCSLLVLGLAHGSLSWLAKSIGSARNQSWQWPWRWTVCGLIGITLLFLVGMSVGGAVHQFGWISASSEPLYERKPRYLNELFSLKEIDMEFRGALMDTNAIADVRRAIWNEKAARRERAQTVQFLHILLVVTNKGEIDGVIVFPRDPQAKARFGGYFITADDSKTIPAKELPDLLKVQNANLVTF
jgi:hypothetical protein